MTATTISFRSDVDTRSHDVISTAREALASFEDIVYHFDAPAEPGLPGRFAPLPSGILHGELGDYLEGNFPDGLFAHQAEAIRRILSGENLVVSTSTSSGKSLIFKLPVLQAMLEDPDATGLFLYPQKALTADQLLSLESIVQRVPTLARRLESQPRLISRYDSSVPTEDRQAIRQSARILATNPDMLHLGILQYHAENWGQFFKNLRYVIVDECHEYRGIFGANVAYVLRRLRQVCQLHGADPRFIAASATAHGANEHLEKMLGLPFGEVGQEGDGSRRGPKKYWIVGRKDRHHYDTGREIGLALAERGLSVLVFCPSRVVAERMFDRTCRGKESTRDYIRVYRSGISSGEREKIEQGLRDRSVRLVFATNALELGIDIGSLDAVVCVGLPQNMMSFWQRAGRVGRGRKTGAVIVVPADSPIDSYYADHPEELFRRENESLALPLDNGHVVKHHYACAIVEAGGGEEGLAMEALGSPFERIGAARANGELDDHLFYSSDPHPLLNIRCMGSENFTLELDGENIGHIDEVHLLREAPSNAIYRHNGVAYRVRSILRRERVVKLVEEHSHNETRVTVRKTVKVRRLARRKRFGSVVVAEADLDIREFLCSIVERNAAGEIRHTQPGSSGMRPVRLPTVGTLLKVEKPLWPHIVSELGGECAAKSAIESASRVLGDLFPVVSGPCDRRDYAVESEIQESGAVIYLHDTAYGGADLTTHASERIRELVHKGIERIRSCTCADDAGCLRCVQNRDVDRKSSKADTLYVLGLIERALIEESPIMQEDAEETGNREEDERVCCPECRSSVPVGKFCFECGAKFGAS